MCNIKRAEKKVKQTRVEEAAHQKAGNEMPNIDGAMPAVSGRHDGSDEWNIPETYNESITKRFT